MSLNKSKFDTTIDSIKVPQINNTLLDICIELTKKMSASKLDRVWDEIKRHDMSLVALKICKSIPEAAWLYNKFTKSSLWADTDQIDIDNYESDCDSDYESNCESDCGSDYDSDF